MGEQWSAWEAAHAAAPTNEAKAAAAAPALVLCRRGCPEVQLCAERARVDSYTGLAAGDAWTDGVSDSEKAEKALRRRLAQPVGSERRAGLAPRTSRAPRWPNANGARTRSGSPTGSTTTASARRSPHRNPPCCGPRPGVPASPRRTPTPQARAPHGSWSPSACRTRCGACAPVGGSRRGTLCASRARSTMDLVPATPYRRRSAQWRA